VLALGLGAGDVVLVKGSEESRMEQVVQRLLAAPTAADDLLVRQDAGWRQRVFLSQERPTWVEVDLSAIGHNVQRIKQIVGSGVEVMAVLKADAYGHGALRVARTALLHGASALAVACLSEAITLRENGINAPILILGYTPPWQAAEIARYGLTATVYSLDVAQHLSRAAIGRRHGRTAVHIKVDSGMGRLGLQPADVVSFADELARLEGLDVQGIFTHFATADSSDQEHYSRQHAAFDRVLADLGAHGFAFRYVHAANSAAILAHPEARYNMVRLGLAMHGLDPSPDVRCPSGFRRALSFKTQVAQVKSFPSGSCISYGCRFVTARPSRIAVIPVGYGDGFRRSPRNWGEVLVRGRRAPIVGTVCMDMCMIDVTEIPGVRPGDEVILIGRQGDDAITVEDVAERLGTINYEVVTQILARVPREVAPGDLA
jgi:alanine racemase